MNAKKQNTRQPPTEGKQYIYLKELCVKFALPQDRTYIEFCKLTGNKTLQGIRRSYDHKGNDLLLSPDEVVMLIDKVLQQ